MRRKSEIAGVAKVFDIDKARRRRIEQRIDDQLSQADVAGESALILDDLLDYFDEIRPSVECAADWVRWNGLLLDVVWLSKQLGDGAEEVGGTG